jgi:uncharacterized membrane protein
MMSSSRRRIGVALALVLVVGALAYSRYSSYTATSVINENEAIAINLLMLGDN